MRAPTWLPFVLAIGCGASSSSNSSTQSPTELADDTTRHEIRLERASIVGQRERVSITKDNSKSELTTIDGDAKRLIARSSVTVSATHTVIAVNDDGQAVDSRYVIHSLTIGEARGPRRLLAGETVVVVHRGSKASEGTLNAPDTELDAETVEVLSDLFKLEVSTGRSDRVFGTDRRLGVGQSWKLDPERVRNATKADGLPSTLDHIAGEMKLVSEATVGDQPCLEIAGGFNATVSSMDDMPKAFGQQAGQLKVMLWGMFPKNPKLPKLKGRMKIHFTFEASGVIEGQHVVIQIEVEEERIEEVEPLPN